MTFKVYRLEVDEVTWIGIPRGSQILSVEEQNGEICLTTLGDAYAGKVTRKFVVYKSDETVEDGLRVYLGTVQIKGVIHYVFEEPVRETS